MDGRSANAMRSCAHAGANLAGALAVLCSNSILQYNGLWEEGVRMLGERGVIELANRSRPLEAKLSNRRVTVWHDSLDRSVRSVLNDFEDDGYRLWRYCTNLTSRDWVLDIGGYLGLVAMYARIQAPVVNILTIEPSPWNYFLLRFNLLHNGLAEGVVALWAGMGRWEKQAAGLLHNFWHATDGLARGPIGASGTRDGEVEYTAPMATLPALMHKYAIQDVALLKLDCEGCEWETALEWHRLGLWNRFRIVVGEFHDTCRLASNTADLMRGPLNAKECVPQNMTLEDAKNVWRLLCAGAYSRLLQNCWRPYFRWDTFPR